MVAFDGLFQKKYHSVVSTLAHCIQGSNEACLRVRAQAANTLGLFVSDECDDSYITPYLQTTLKALVNLLQTSQNMVAQTRAIAAISRIASVTDADFLPFYNGFMQILKKVLSLPVNTDTLPLRNATFMAIGNIGMAVGKKTFANDAAIVMKAVFVVLKSKGEARDQQMVAAMACACSVCKTMGEAFSQFLPNILRELLQQATQKVEYNCQVLGSNTGVQHAQQNGNVTSTTLNMRGIGDLKLDLNTAQMEEKYTALELLGTYAETLPSAFAAHSTAVLKSILPIINEKGYSLVRQFAALSTAKVFGSFLTSVKSGVFSSAQADIVIANSMSLLLQALANERQAEVSIDFADAVRGMIYECYSSGGATADGVKPPPAYIFPFQLVDKTMQNLGAAAKASLLRRNAAQENAKQLGADVYDEEEAMMINDHLEYEDELMTHATDAIGYIIKQHKSAALPALEKFILPIYSHFLDAKKYPEALQHCAICVYDDMIEHCSPGAHKHLRTCIGAILKNMNSETVYMRCAALYGIGMMVEHAPAFVRQSIPQIQQRLMALIGAPEARNEENAPATDNAISALGKILENFSSQCDSSKLWAVWLQYLPLRGDDIEAKVVHAQLVRLVRNKNAQLLAPATLSRVLPEIARVMLEVLAQEEELADQSTISQMIATIKQLHSSQQLPAQLMSKIMNDFSEEQRSIIKAVMQ